MRFNPSPEYTIGVEWELQLLDSRTLDLADGIMPLMEFFPGATHVKPEFIQSCVELTSCIAENSDEAVEHLRQLLTRTLQRCDELEMSLCGAGTHPFCRRLALITPLPRYRYLEKAAGHLAHTQITFATHAHVGMRSGDQAMRAMSRMIPAMPVLIALSANSPFWRGHDTGHLAYRHRILAAAPSYGLPMPFDSWQDFERFLEAATRAGMIRHFKDIHWDIRPHPDFGTLEIRVMDAASNLHDLHGLIALSHCLALGLADGPTTEVNELLPHDLPYWIENQNRYKAGMRGLDAEYVMDDSGHHRPLRELAADLLAFCRPIATDIDETHGLDVAAELLQEAPPCQTQIDAFEANHSMRSVVKALQRSLRG